MNLKTSSGKDVEAVLAFDLFNKLFVQELQYFNLDFDKFFIVTA